MFFPSNASKSDKMEEKNVVLDATEMDSDLKMGMEMYKTITELKVQTRYDKSAEIFLSDLTLCGIFIDCRQAVG